MMMMMMRPKSARRHCSYKSAGNSAVFIAHTKCATHTIFPASDGFALSLCSSELSHILGRCCCRVAKEQYGRRRRGKEKKRRKPSTHKKYKPSSAFDCVLLIWLPLVFFFFLFHVATKVSEESLSCRRLHFGAAAVLECELRGLSRNFSVIYANSTTHACNSSPPLARIFWHSWENRISIFHTSRHTNCLDIFFQYLQSHHSPCVFENEELS